MKAAAVTVKIFSKPRELSALNSIALALATCFGTGYLPIAPATWGSIFGIGVYLFSQKAIERFDVWAAEHNFANVLLESAHASITLIFLIALFLIGIWAATRVEKLTGEKDSKIIVIDEVVGQLLTFLFIPQNFGWWTVLVGFFAFRLFDIWKLYPANKLESLPAGLGVMADDVMAGFYAATLLSFVCSIYLALL